MRLLTKDVAAMVGLKESTIRRYRIRGIMPEPDGYDFGHPWWTEETIKNWRPDVTEPRRSAVPAPGSSDSGSTAPGKEIEAGGRDVP